MHTTDTANTSWIHTHVCTDRQTEKWMDRQQKDIAPSALPKRSGGIKTNVHDVS